MNNIYFFIEGKSDKAFLKPFITRFFKIKLEEIVYIVFNGKKKFKKNLSKRIKSITKNDKAIILIDQDNENCKKLKQQILDECKEATSNILIRIACRELENWYLGDIESIIKIYPKSKAINYDKAKYRNIDSLEGSKELSQITNKEYKKIEGSEQLGKIINTNFNKNKSLSFKIFCKSLERFIIPSTTC